MKKSRIVFLGVALASCTACGSAPSTVVVTVDPIARVSTPPPVQPTIDKPPAHQRKVDINFENRVHLIAVSIDPEHASRGDHVRLVFTWRCDVALGDGWQLLTHLQNESGRADNLDYAGTLRELGPHGRQRMGPEHWEASETYVDEQTYRVPEWAKGTLTVYVGIWRGDARLRIVAGPNDGENRAIVGKIEVE